MISPSNTNIATCLTIEALQKKILYYRGKRDFYFKLFNAPAGDYAHIPTLAAMEKEMLRRRTEYYSSLVLRWQAKLDIRNALQ